LWVGYSSIQQNASGIETTHNMNNKGMQCVFLGMSSEYRLQVIGVEKESIAGIYEVY
jgi:hypothetical protein